MTLQKGKKNCITDVEGVQVGHKTLYERLNKEETICTGVTAIIPHSGNLFFEKTRAACHVINGYGKTSGLIQIEELGLIESPIMLTNSFNIGPIMEGTVTYMLEKNKEIGISAGTLNVVVGECNDGYLNSIRLPSIRPEHAIEAIKNAKSSATDQGSIGAGKGMICFGYKGGIGTSSRVITTANEKYTVGCLVLSNFGNGEDALFADFPNMKNPNNPDGSIMIIIATDAPIYDRQLKRVAKRTTAGLGRVGSHMDNGSGDIAIAFTTVNTYQQNTNVHLESISYLRDDHKVMSQLFQAVVEVTEEAIINSLKYNETTVGQRGRVIKKAPL